MNTNEQETNLNESDQSVESIAKKTMKRNQIIMLGLAMVHLISGIYY